MKILVYADVGLGLIDGSSIWAQSVAEVLSTQFHEMEVFMLSREPVTDRGTFPALQRMPNVKVISSADHLSAFPPPLGDPARISGLIEHLDAEHSFQRIIVRAPAVASILASRPQLRHRVWAYVLTALNPAQSEPPQDLVRLISHVGGIIVQSDPQRALYESLIPEASFRTGVLPPMVKAIENTKDTVRDISSADKSRVRFIYSGKYSKAWNVEAFFDVPSACAAVGIDAEVTMIGDKVHNEPEDKGFRVRISDKFVSTDGVTWMGAMERDEAIRASAGHHLGLCWRTKALDTSLEISTKFLEFASQGVPAVVNRTAAYELLLGEDYPYYVSSMDDVVAAAQRVLADRAEHEVMRQRVKELARAFNYESAGKRLASALRIRDASEPDLASSYSGRKVLVASHDLKFVHTALRWLGDTGRFEFSFDMWKGVNKHDANQSHLLLKDAQVIFCEWCAGQAVWYSRHKRPEQTLFIRLHRFEAFTDLPAQVEIANVDGIIVVSEYLRQYCAKQFGWPLEKLVVIPQYCVTDQFARSKTADAHRTLGLVGMNSFLKRPDRAVDILRLVRAQAPEFRLRIRSSLPWDIAWLWDKSEERERYLEFFSALEADTDLRDAVIFDRPGADMPEWFRNIGYVLSTSDIEGCHTAVAEGMSSGAWPVVINWEGAESVYPRYIHRTVREMAAEILRIYSAPNQDGLARQVMERAREEFDISLTVDQLKAWFLAPLDDRQPSRQVEELL